MISVKNITKTYENDDGSKIRALKGVNLELGDNGVTFICGESGNGKSTLLSILAGLDSFDTGDILLNGVSFKKFTSVDFDNYRRNVIGFVFEDSNLIETLNVGENIKLGRLSEGEAPTKEEVELALKKVKLDADYYTRMPNQLSAGQKQRISIARILVKSPDIIFMDEPTAHLDEKTSNQIWGIIKEISKNCLIICVSHNSAIVEKYGDRKVVLENNVVGEDINLTTTAKTKKVKEEKKVETVENKLVSPKEVLHEEKKANRRLNFKYSFSLAWNSLTARKWRTLFMVILCTFSVTFFAVFAVINNYSETYAMSNAIMGTAVNSDEHISPYLSFYKGLNDNYTRAVDVTEISSIVNSVDVNLKTAPNQRVYYNIGFLNNNLKPIHSTFRVQSVITLDEPYSDNGSKYVNLSGINGVNNLNQTILFGKYPTSTLQKTNGVVISDYILALIKLYGLPSVFEGEDVIPAEKDTETSLTLIDYDNVSSVWCDKEIEEKIIGHSIVINKETCIISGIYKTDFSNYSLTEQLVHNANDAQMYEYNLANIYSAIHVSSSFNQIESLLNEPVTSVVVSISKKDLVNNGNDGYKINYISADSVEKILVNASEKGYSPSSVVNQSIQKLTNNMAVFKTLILLIASFTAIFAVVTMYYFITQIIVDRYKDVGVLKALGFTTFDINSIFLLSTAIFVVLAFIITLIITGASALIANSVITEIMLINFEMLNINFMVIAYIFIVCLAISFAGALIPLIKFASKQPNEIIKGFK